MQQPAASPISALPPPGARLLAFAAILVAGVCGGLIGWSVTDLQCGNDKPVRINAVQGGDAPTTTVADDGDDGGCDVAAGLGGVVGAVIGAGGTAVIAVLVLRAMGEWRRNLEESGGGPDPDVL